MKFHHHQNAGNNLQKNNTEEGFQDPAIAQQIRILLNLYQRLGPINFDYGNVDESVGQLRRELQNPDIFAVSSLPMQAWWTLSEDTWDMLKKHKDVIVEEYERYHSLLLETKVINSDVRSNNESKTRGYCSVQYLMREGKWCSGEIQEEKFVKTVEMLLRLPLMENG